MNECKLQHGSRINTADEGTLERSVGSNVFEIPNYGLVSKAVTPSTSRRRLFCKSMPGGTETSSSAGSLGLHIHIFIEILDHPTAPRRASQEHPVREFLLAWSQWR